MVCEPNMHPSLAEELGLSQSWGRMSPGSGNSERTVPALGTFEDGGRDVSASAATSATELKGPCTETSASTLMKSEEDLVITRSAEVLGRGVDAVASTMKRELLDAFTSARGALSDHYAELVLASQKQHASEIETLRRENDELKALLETYAQSVHTKDQVINSLKEELAREQLASKAKEDQLASERVRLDEQREHANSTFAERHHQFTMLRKAFTALHGVVEKRWKARLEKACKARAHEVCTALAHEYQSKIEMLELELAEAHAEIEDFKRKRLEFQDGMKKAFMRGVCALNMETMAMFDSTVGHGPSQFEPVPVDEWGAALPDSQIGKQHVSRTPDSQSARKTLTKDPIMQDPVQTYVRQGITKDPSTSRRDSTSPRQPLVRVEKHYRPRTVKIVP